MDSEMIAWFQVNWVFGLVLFSIIYLLCNRKESHEPIKTFAFLFFFIWGVWRLVSNYILNQWGLSALDAWNLGEMDHGLPNIDLTIPGWIMFGIMMISVLGAEIEKKEKQSEKKEVQKETTEEAEVEESLEKKYVKKVDDLFDDI
tara:strand:- start:67 stop:501 length:435 start_codon:yes stop_codon:yes gene_type:complete